jgi:hypothetical protein
LRARYVFALRTGNPALALHHARLWRQLAPGDASAHAAVADALLAFAVPRRTEARDVLDHGLAAVGFADLGARARLEQRLAEVLVGLGDDASLARARTILGDLLARPATRDDRKLRDALATRIGMRVRERGGAP